MKYLRRTKHGGAVFAVLLLLLSVSGCSLFSSSTPPTPSPSSQSSDTSDPYWVEIVEELNDGSRLTVLANVVANGPWDPEDAILKFSLMRGFETVSLQEHPLSHFVSPDLPLVPHSKMPIILSAELQPGVSDYQLDLSWGEGKAKVKSAASKALIELREVQISEQRSCDPEGGCTIRYEITGNLLVAPGADTKAAKLLVSFEARNQSPGNILESMGKPEELPLGSRQLQGSVPFKIKVQQPLTEAQAAKFRPVVRVGWGN